MNKCDYCLQTWDKYDDEYWTYFDIESREKPFQVCSTCLDKTQKLLLPKYFKEHNFCFIETSEHRVMFDTILPLKLDPLANNCSKLVFGVHIDNVYSYTNQDKEVFIGKDVKTMDDKNVQTLLASAQSQDNLFVAWKHFGIQEFSRFDALKHISEFEKLQNLMEVPRFASFKKSNQLSRFAFPENDPHLYRFPNLKSLIRFLHPGRHDFVRNQVWIATPEFLKLFPFAPCYVDIDKWQPLTEILDSERIQVI